MADSAPALDRRQSVVARHPVTMRPPRAPLISSYSIPIISTLLLITPTFCYLQTENLYIVCKEPNSRMCEIWPYDTENSNNVLSEIYQIDVNSKCGLSDLKPIPPHRRFISVNLFNEKKPKKIFCKTMNMRVAESPNVVTIDVKLPPNRIRRQTEYRPRGRYRGQTQSQYLAIDRGNGKDEGKAEALSAADSSRAIVSGNSGMGQAQSQTIYDPNCDDCLGRLDTDAANLVAQGHKPRYGTNQNGETSPNQPSGPSDTSHTYQGTTQAGYQPGSPGSRNWQAPDAPSPNRNVLQNGNYGTNQGQGFPDRNQYLNQNYPSNSHPNTPGNIVTSKQLPSNQLPEGNLPGGNYDTSIRQPQFISPGSQPGNILDSQVPNNYAIYPGYNNQHANQPTSSSGDSGLQRQTPVGSLNTHGVPITNQPDGSYGPRHTQQPINYIQQYPGHGMNHREADQHNIRGGPNGLNNGPGILPDGSYNRFNGPDSTQTQQPGSQFSSNPNYPINQNGVNWPLISGLLPGGSSYFCCVVSPNNNAIGSHPPYWSNLPSPNGVGSTGPTNLPSPNGPYGGSSTGPTNLPSSNGPYGGVSTGHTNLPSPNGPYGGGTTGQTNLPSPNGPYVGGSTGQTNLPSPNGPYGGGSTGQTNLPSPNGPYGGGTTGQTNLPSPNGPYRGGSTGQTNLPSPNGPYRGGSTGQTNLPSPNGPYGGGSTGQTNLPSPNGPYGGGSSSQTNLPSPNGPYGGGSTGQTGLPSPNGPYGGGRTGQTNLPSLNGPYGEENTGKTNLPSPNGPYGGGNTGQTNLPSLNGPYGGGNIGQTNQPSPNGPYGGGSTGQTNLPFPNGPYAGGNTGQTNLPSPNGPYGGGSTGQTNLPSPNGPYGGGGTGQTNLPSPNGPYGGGSTGQTNLPSPNGPYGGGSGGQTNLPPPNGSYGGGSTGQTNLPSPNGPYGGGSTGQTNLPSPNGPYGGGSTGQTNLPSPNGPYGGGSGGQTNLPPPNGPYRGGSTGQTNLPSPNGPYRGGSTGQTNLPSPNGPYGGGSTGQTNLPSPNGPNGGSSMGQTNLPSPNGPYGGGSTGQTNLPSPNGPYGGGSTGQTNLPSPNGPYGGGSTGQTNLPSPNGPYGGGSTGQTNLPSPNGPYGGGSTGQTNLPSPNGPYGGGSTGQTNLPSPNGPYGGGSTGQTNLPSPNGPYGGGTTGQTNLPSPNGPYGGGSTGQTNLPSPNGPNGGGSMGQTNLPSPNGAYEGGSTRPTNLPSPNGPYGGGSTGQTNLPSANGPYGGSSTGPTNLPSPNGPYGGGTTGQNYLPSPNGPYGGGGNTGQNNVHPQLGNNNEYQGRTPQNKEYGGVPQNVVDPNSITTVDDYDSDAQASVSQVVNGTTALASSKGGNEKGRAQTQVEGTYTGTGSFSANAEISDDNKAAQSHVSGSKKGASSSAEGRGRKNKSQASVKLGSETGAILTDSQSSGDMHSSSSQVQGSVKGGMADAQARGPGSTSSQAQIGFTPYKQEDKAAHDLLKTPFEGGGTASAQTSGRMGTSQSQLRGTFKYGITYNGAAQAGSSLDKDAVFSNLLPFDKIDVFDEKSKNINVNILPTEKPEDTVVTWTEYYEENQEDAEKQTPNKEIPDHTHSDHHKTVDQLNTTTRPPPEGNRRSFQSNFGTNGYEYATDKEETPSEEYDIDDGFGAENEQIDQSEYNNYDDLPRGETHQSLHGPNKKGVEIKQTTGGNTQHIILGSLQDHDAQIIQKNSEHPDEGKTYQPGERVPGMGGYKIPVGFTGSVKSVASKEKTYAVGSKTSPSQAQTVTLTPGVGRVKYSNPNYYGKNINPKDLRSLYNPKSDDNRYLSVSKSVTRDLDSENNIRKQYSHTYYTKSSSCGYFTFTCTMVSSAEGKKKVCRPKIPTNPDGTPMRC